MKLTNQQLKQIIREELQNALGETRDLMPGAAEDKSQDYYVTTERGSNPNEVQIIVNGPGGFQKPIGGRTMDKKVIEQWKNMSQEDLATWVKRNS